MNGDSGKSLWYHGGGFTPVTRLRYIPLLIPTLALAQSLDFDLYRATVEPIFLKKREGHARCVSCHVAALSRFQLQMLADGQTQWTPEQSRQNFQIVSTLVNLKNVQESPLLKHPLAESAGGDKAHSGGEQFKSKTDPDWKLIETWIKATH